MTVSTDTSKTGLAAVSTSEYFNLDSAYLRKWRKALARARTGGAVAKIACIGDSTARGQGSNGASFANSQVYSFPNQLASLLSKTIAAQNNSVFGDGAMGAIATSDPRVGLSGSFTPNTTSLGGAMFKATAAGTLTFTPTAACKTWDVYYYMNPGSFTLDIGGVGTATTSTAATTNILKATIVGASDSTSPLHVNWASGTVFIIGVEGRSSTDLVSVWNFGASGWRVVDWTGTTNIWQPLAALPFMAPDLSIINLTINDATNATDPATYRTNMQALITAAQGSGDVILMTGAPGSSTDQTTYRTICYQLAQANSAPLIDLNTRFGSYTIANALGFMFDTIHPNGLGYGDTALAVNKIVSAP